MLVTKRDGRTEPFDIAKIESAVTRCALHNELSAAQATSIAGEVARQAANLLVGSGLDPVTVEDVQDTVEHQLMASGRFSLAKSYILYRDEHARTRDEMPISVEDAAYVRSTKSYFPTEYQAFQYMDKYARYNDGLHRRETWPESVDRVLRFFRAQVPNFDAAVSPEDVDFLQTSMLQMDAMSSMRVLQMAGPALERCHVGVYNCSFRAITDLAAFDEILYVLMQGTGAGFSVEADHVDRLPRIRRQRGRPAERYIIQDSTEGWCSALRTGMERWFDGYDVAYDFSQIRLAGTQLKTKGGQASGPEPLKQLLAFARARVLANQAGRLNTLDAHDIACFSGKIVQVGGVRRAALISLSDLDDDDMRDAKRGDLKQNEQRYQANNSAVYTEPPTDIEFLSEWLSLAKSGNGERGIFNRDGLLKSMPKRRRRVPRIGVNPCVTGDTVVMTLGGPRTFAQLANAGEDVMVYAWHPKTKTPVVRWMRHPRLTRRNEQLLELEFDSGLKLRCTPDHSLYSFRGQKLQAQDLRIGQSVRAWSMSRHRDGHLRVHGWDSAANKANHQWVGRMVYECAFGSIPEGCIVHHRNEQKEDNSPENLHAISPIEHNVIHYPTRFEAGFDGTAANHKLVAVRDAGFGDVYNGTVDDAHTYIVLDPLAIAGDWSGIISANCGEIVLRDKEFCNLSIAVARENDTREDLQRKVRAASILGTLQATLTNFQYLSADWKKNCDDERLLGVDINGQMDCRILRQGLTGRGDFLESLRELAIETNREYADKLQIPHSAAVTCVKPSGNSSQLFNCSSGLHARYAPYYVRRFIVGALTPMLQLLRDQGAPIVQDPSGTFLIEFPVKSPDKAITRNDLSALEQLENWLEWKTRFTEHNPSITVYVEPDEWVAVGAWVSTNWDRVGGIAFLPKDGGTYILPPYTEITKDEYDQRLAAFVPIDYSKLPRYEKVDTTTVHQELACVGDLCELP